MQKANKFDSPILYRFFPDDFPYFPLSVIEVGLTVELCFYIDFTYDYFGGIQEHIGASSFWVEVLEIHDHLLQGRVKDNGNLFAAGTILFFKYENICRVRGDMPWNIAHLTVDVSESIVYQHEKVGYFYYTNERLPLSFSRAFFAVSEIFQPKEDIPMITIPLSALLTYDPIVGKYLDVYAEKSFIRTDDLTFKEYNAEPRDRNIFPHW